MRRWLISRRGADGCSCAGIGGRCIGRVGDVDNGMGGASSSTVNELEGRFISRPADRGTEGGRSSGGSICTDVGRLACGLSSAGGGAMLAKGHMPARPPLKDRLYAAKFGEVHADLAAISRGAMAAPAPAPRSPSLRTEFISVGCNRLVHVLDWSSSNLVAYAAGAMVAIFNPQRATVVRTLLAHKKRVNTVRWLPSDPSGPIQLVSGGADNHIAQWTVSSDGQAPTLSLGPHLILPLGLHAQLLL